MEMVDPIVFRLTIFVLAIFVGYFVVWSVTPALHTPLMAVTNAISSVIVVGALIAAGVSVHTKPANIVFAVTQDGATFVNNKPVDLPVNDTAKFKQVLNAAAADAVAQCARSAWTSKGLGFFALILASVNIFGGFLVTQRMLAMYKKKGSK